MENQRELFLQIPDTVAVTDAYGYVLDFNRNDAVTALAKGLRLTKLFPDVLTAAEATVRIGDSVYRRVTTPVIGGKTVIGYTVIFTDITEEERLSQENLVRRQELAALAEAKQNANRKLSDYAMEVKNLSDYAEQLRIARSIHDDSGHAVTEIHTICQMCLTLMNQDLQAYRDLLSEGIEICKKASGGGKQEEFGSLAELAESFAKRASFPIHIKSEGAEPAFMKERYAVVARMVKEAYHNTLEHSLADEMEITLSGEDADAGRGASDSPGRAQFTIAIRDNGCFRGPFEKGFGLLAMEEYVKASGGELTFETAENAGFGIVARWKNGGDRHE